MRRKRHKKIKVWNGRFVKSIMVEGFRMETTVKIPENVYKKIMYWIDKCSFEISGLGTVEVKNGVPWVTDVILIEQENSAASTDLDSNAVNKAMYEMRDKGDLRFWWHSHVNMGVFWSGTDTTTIKELSEHGWFIATVFNKKREMKTALASSEPFSFMIDNVKTDIISDLPEAAIKILDAEYDAKVKEKKWKSSYGHWDEKQKKWIKEEDETDWDKEKKRLGPGKSAGDRADSLYKDYLEKEKAKDKKKHSGNGNGKHNKFTQQELEELRSYGMPESEIQQWLDLCQTNDAYEGA